VRLFLELGDERARAWQYHVEVVDAEEQEKPVARSGLVRAQQRRMLVCAPLVEAEQHRAIGIADLTKVSMRRWRFGLAEERPVLPDAARYVPDADDRPDALHDTSAGAGVCTSERRATMPLVLAAPRYGDLASVQEWP